MKKLVLAAFAVALLPTLGLAQGTLNFGTTSSGTQYFLLADGTTRAPSGTLATLWWSPDNVAAYSLIGNNTVTVNGWLTTAVVATTGAGTAGGATAWFYLAGSSANGQLTGRTANFQNATGNPGGSPPTNPAPLAGWNAPITLVPVPEPSTFALAGLGVAALLLFRRRK